MGLSNEMYLQTVQMELQEIVEKANEGELSNLDALIELRTRRSALEKGLEIIKDFENDKQNEIAHEASQYPEGYRGYEVKEVSGKKLYSYKGIPEIETATNTVSQLQDKYKSAFEGVLKGTVQLTEEEGVKYWIDSDGSLNPFPELNIGKSYLLVKEKSNNK